MNGAFGGITPRNELSMHLFSERHPIPKNVKHKVNKDGTLSDEIITLKDGDAVRLIQSSVILDVTTAIAIRNWLDDRIKSIETLEGQNKGKKQKKKGLRMGG